MLNQKMRLMKAALFAMSTLLLLTGCGGGGAGVSTDVPAGIYRGTYSRGVGDIVLDVKSDNTVDVIVNDEDKGSYTGTGTAERGNVDASASNGISSINISASIINGELAGSTNGDISILFNAPLLSTGNNIFFGEFAAGIKQQGSSSIVGNMAFDAENTGDVSGTITFEEAFTFTGSVSGTGTFVFQATDTKAIVYTFEGIIRLGSGSLKTVSGTWSSTNGKVGTFSGNNI